MGTKIPYITVHAIRFWYILVHCRRKQQHFCTQNAKGHAFWRTFFTTLMNE